MIKRAVSVIGMALLFQSCGAIFTLAGIGEPVVCEVRAASDFQISIAGCYEKPGTISADSVSRAGSVIRDREYYTPNSFVIHVGTVFIAEGVAFGATAVLLDELDDSRCTAIDLARGEKLSDFFNASATYASDTIDSLRVAILPHIEYSFIDDNGNSQSGSYRFPDTSGIEPTATLDYQYGHSRNRILLTTSFSCGEENTWGNTPMVFDSESDRKITLLVDMEGIVAASPVDPTDSTIHYNFNYACRAVINGMYYDTYRLGISGGDRYPYKVTVLYSTSGIPVMNGVWVQGSLLPGEVELPVLSNIGGDGSQGYLLREKTMLISSDSRLTFVSQAHPTEPEYLIGPLNFGDMDGVEAGDSIVDIRYSRTVISE